MLKHIDFKRANHGLKRLHSDWARECYHVLSASRIAVPFNSDHDNDLQQQ
jgi:hypothetical protein